MNLCIYWTLDTSMKWRKVNFKLSLTDLNSVFSFSLFGCHTKIKEQSLPNYLLILKGE